MGFFDKMASAMTGQNSETSVENRKRINELFAEKVPEADQYEVLAAFRTVEKTKIGMSVLTGKRNVEITYFNYILGFRREPEMEFVLIDVSPDLNTVGNPIVLKKSASKAKKTLQGLYQIENAGLEDGKIAFGPIANAAIGAVNSGYIIKVAYDTQTLQDLKNFFEEFSK